MVNPAGDWGQSHAPLGSNIATGRFSRINKWGGGKGFGVHWFPVGKSMYTSWGRDPQMIGGPGLPATGFIDIAIQKAADDLHVEMEVANAKTAEIAEDFCNSGTYKSVHEMKVDKAKHIYGSDPATANLWREVEDFPSTPTGGVKWGKFNVTETAGMRAFNRPDSLRAGLTQPDVIKISNLPKLTTIGTSTTSSLSIVEGGLSQQQVSKYGYTKGAYTFFRSAPVSGITKHEVDVAVMLTDTGEWKGFAEFGVSDFRTIDPSSAGGKWTHGQPGEIRGGKMGRDFYIKGGSIVQFYAEERIDTGLKMTAQETIRMYETVFIAYRTKIKEYAAVNFRTMVRGRQHTRHGDYGFYGRANDFDAFLHIRVNLFAPAPGAKNPRYQCAVYFPHPIATSWNFGLSGAASGQLIPYTPGTGTREWRVRPVAQEEQTIGFH